MHIIGAGRVGGALSSAAHAAGQPAVLLDRDADWSVLSATDGPIVVATRNDDLDGVVERVPATRRADLVFVQNGMLRPWLQDQGLTDNTRGLLFFAVPSRGATIQPGPPSPVVGAHANAVVTFLSACGAPAECVSQQAFTNLEHEKLVWNSAFGLLCQALGATVGQVVSEHNDTLAKLVRELHEVASTELDITLSLQALLPRLCDYSMSIPDYTGAVKEWPWRNGWYVRVAREHGVEMPLHTALCEQAGVVA